MAFRNRFSFILFLIVLAVLVPFVSASVFMNEILANEPGTNKSLEWIELYNNETSSVNLAGWNLTDGVKYYTINASISGMSYLIFYGYETNIELNNPGDTLNLTNNESSLIDSISYTNAVENVSLGRYPDGSNHFVNFTQPTPNFTNNYAPTIFSMIPGNNSNLSVFPVSFKYTASDDFNTSIYCIIYINSTATDASIVENNTQLIISKNLTDGFYSWSVSCNDGFFTTISNTSNFVLDSVPRLNVVESAGQNSVSINLTFSEIVSFNFTSQFGNYTNSSNTAYLFSYSGLSPSTAYNYNVSFCDITGNCNMTNHSFTTQSLPPPASVESCFDNMQNQDETGVDCGGVCRTKCPTQFHGSSSGGGSPLTLSSAKFTLNFTEIKNYSVQFAGLDRIILIFHNNTYVLMFSNTSLKGTNTRFYPLKYNIDVPAEKTTRTYLSNQTEDVVFYITEISESSLAYQKYGIKDYLINLSAQVIKLEKPKPVVNETPVVVKNITVMEKAAPEPKLGRIAIKAKSSYFRPASEITGFIVASSIIVMGLALYLGLRKIFAW